MRRLGPLLMMTCLLIAADQPPVQSPDPQARHEPGGTPGVGQKYLEKYVGEWEVAKAFFPTSGPPVRSTGSCRQTMIQDGRFLESNFAFERDGKKSTGRGILGFDPATGRFTSFWIDSRQTRISARQSREPFDGETIVLYSLSLDPDDKDSRRSKTVSALKDGGSKLVHRQYALSSDGKERLMMELVMSRKQ